MCELGRESSQVLAPTLAFRGWEEGEEKSAEGKGGETGLFLLINYDNNNSYYNNRCFIF